MVYIREDLIYRLGLSFPCQTHNYICQAVITRASFGRAEDRINQDICSVEYNLMESPAACTPFKGLNMLQVRENK
jgi:hypothetical protein